jgi:hypothetical protein
VTGSFIAEEPVANAPGSVFVVLLLTLNKVENGQRYDHDEREHHKDRPGLASTRSLFHP